MRRQRTLPRRGALAALGVAAAGAFAGGGNAKLVSSTYLGGTKDDLAAAMATGPDGMLWIAASSASLDWPGATRQVASNRRTDVAVLRIDPATRTVLSSAWIGGTDFDFVTALTFDATGNAYVAGMTTSHDFPGRAEDPGSANDYDVFVARLAPDAKSFAWSAVIAASQYDESRALCVLPGGDPVLVGETDSFDLPVVGRQGRDPFSFAGRDVFVARLAAADGKIVFCRRLGGFADDEADAVVTSPAGGVIVAGRTFSPDFPTSDPPSRFSNFGWTGFLSEIAADGADGTRSRIYGSTWFTSLAAGPPGSLLCAGQSSDPSLPVAAFRHMRSESFQDAVVVRLDADSWKVAGGTFFGGTGNEYDARLALAPDGTIRICGTTQSADLPLPGIPGGVTSATEDFYVAAIAPEDFRVLAGATIGSSDRDVRVSLAVATDGSTWLAGATAAEDFELLDPVASFAAGDSGYDAVLARFDTSVPRLRPSAPLGVVATAADGHRVDLRWQAGDGLAKSFEIERADWTEFQRVAVVPAGSTSWTDLFVQPDRGYTYTVRALSDAGASPLSEHVRAVTPGTIALEVTSGTLRMRRRGTDGDFTLEGTIRAAAGGSVPDLAAIGASISIYSEVGAMPALRIPAVDPRWRRRGAAFAWRADKSRFDWDPATGAFRLRSRRQATFAGAGSIVTLQFVSGSEAGSATDTWRLETPRRLRTP